ncbi:9159_t:CDS:2 [Acaulospora colombiana]|uniref:9159_t:CDS:1 n=1 Tax=Acaulospora colombiana TaxID=27376 RepID=A0ACA9M4N2_9GLOM|nr:9159_t:CDS:2 [Acaulospora colombiana]
MSFLLAYYRSQPTNYARPLTKHSDLAQNYYFNRDTRRNYPRLAVYTQEDVALLIAASHLKSITSGEQGSSESTQIVTIPENITLTEAIAFVPPLYSAEKLPPTPHFHPTYNWKKSDDADALPADVKITITLITILALLVPCGYIMKLLIMLTSSLYHTDNNTTSVNNPSNLTTPIDESILTTIVTPTTWSSFNLPFCTALSPSDIVLHSDIVYSTFPLLVIKLFPSITDTEFWFRVMCNRLMQHLHLGLFFLGSISNIYTAYITVDELFGIFMGEIRRETRKTTLAVVCAIVMCFWFHYTLTAFSVPSTREFLQDLPVWFLRWITISLAIFDFGLRRVFFRMNRFSEEDIEIISVQKMDFNDDC